MYKALFIMVNINICHPSLVTFPIWMQIMFVDRIPVEIWFLGQPSNKLFFSRSSVEVEYCGVTNVLHNLLLEHSLIKKSMSVYCDNVSVIYLSGNLVHHQSMSISNLTFTSFREKCFSWSSSCVDGLFSILYSG
uniref:Uncharacterized protein n=1 Tax=Lactuca sativa TaxID=4236 RepID=A0A9R1WM06_LACSA|nr:hypothetical protein LSAT_V11C100035800 [Lactuca sativa]